MKQESSFYLAEENKRLRKENDALKAIIESITPHITAYDEEDLSKGADIQSVFFRLDQLEKRISDVEKNTKRPKETKRNETFDELNDELKNSVNRINNIIKKELRKT